MANKELTVAELRKQKNLQLVAGEVNFDNMELSDLANAYQRVDGMVSITKGRILLAARRQFFDDVEFGHWLKENELDEFTQQTRWNLMRLAEHFTNRETTNMTPTVCIEIAKLMHMDKRLGKKAYDHALGKNLTKKQIIEFVDKLKEEHGIKKSRPKRYPEEETVIEVPTYTTDELDRAKAGTKMLRWDESPKRVFDSSSIEHKESEISNPPQYTDEENMVLELISDKTLEEKQTILLNCLTKISKESMS